MSNFWVFETQILDLLVQMWWIHQKYTKKFRVYVFFEKRHQSFAFLTQNQIHDRVFFYFSFLIKFTPLIFFPRENGFFGQKV